MMGEDPLSPSSSNSFHPAQHVQFLSEEHAFSQESDSMCTIILDPSNITFVPVMTKEENNDEEVVVYNIIDDHIKVEIPEEGNEEVYTEVYTQEVTPKGNNRPLPKSRQGCHVCKVCNKSFAQLVNLVTHERIHTGEKPFECTVCTKRFSQQPNLWKHMRIHTGERPYQCNICKKCFTQQANLTKHVRIHTGERPYACQYCGKRFTQQANLTKHVRLHTGERPFHCAYCTKTFVQQSNLERHERTHTGVKPFRCNVCGESFAQNVHLSKHLRTVHKNTVNTFLIGNQSFVEGEVISGLSTRDVDKDCTETDSEGQIHEIHPTMCIPVLYCTKTGRILRRVD